MDPRRAKPIDSYLTIPPPPSLSSPSQATSRPRPPGIARDGVRAWTRGRAHAMPARAEADGVDAHAGGLGSLGAGDGLGGGAGGEVGGGGGGGWRFACDGRVGGDQVVGEDVVWEANCSGAVPHFPSSPPHRRAALPQLLDAPGVRRRRGVSAPGHPGAIRPTHPLPDPRPVFGGLGAVAPSGGVQGGAVGPSAKDPPIRRHLHARLRPTDQHKAPSLPLPALSSARGLATPRQEAPMLAAHPLPPPSRPDEHPHPSLPVVAAAALCTVLAPEPAPA